MQVSIRNEQDMNLGYGQAMSQLGVHIYGRLLTI